MNQTTILEYLAAKKKEFQNNYNIEEIGLFGSFSRNEQTENSDIDIIYILKENSKLYYFDLYNLEKKLEKEFNRKIELINYLYMNPIIKYKSAKDIIYV